MNLFKTSSLFSIIFLFSLKVVSQDQGYKEEQLTNNAFDNQYASYNKAGEAIVFESNRDGHWQIYSMDIDGKNQRRVINSVSNDRRPTWHPYKNLILFESDRNGVSDLFTFDLDTKELTKVPIPLKGNKSFAQFAPNGKELIFNYKITDDNYNIYMISNNGKRLKTIVNNAYANMYPRFSPSGDAIVYFSSKHTKGQDDEIYVRNMYNRDEVRLTRSPTHDFCPSISNSGSKIVYVTSMEDGKPEIFIMNKDGKSQRRITFNDETDTLPNWSPQDFNLLITGFRNGSFQICKILLKEEL
jgi:TolB protein